MIKFACPSCGASFQVGDEKGGRKGKCPKCGGAIEIPAAPAPVPPPAAADAVPVYAVSGPAAAGPVAASGGAQRGVESPGAPLSVRSLGIGMLTVGGLTLAFAGLSLVGQLTEGKPDWRGLVGLAVLALQGWLLISGGRDALANRTGWKAKAAGYLGLAVIVAALLAVLLHFLRQTGFSSSMAMLGVASMVVGLLLAVAAYVVALGGSNRPVAPGQSVANAPLFGAIGGVLCFGALMIAPSVICFLGIRHGMAGAMCKVQMVAVSRGLMLYQAEYKDMSPPALDILQKTGSVMDARALRCPHSQKPYVYLSEYLRDRLSKAGGLDQDAIARISANLSDLDPELPAFWDADNAHKQGVVFYTQLGGQVLEATTEEFQKMLDKACARALKAAEFRTR